MNINNENTQENTEIEQTVRHFINSENYKTLREVQQRIYEMTEFTPSIRKLVNDLINEENLNKLESKTIQLFK